jgi:glycosyltransferase involved in cell wall biosynthesis
VYLVDASSAITGAFICARNEARALSGIARVILVLPAESHIPEIELGDFHAVRRLPIATLRKSPGAILAYLPRLLIGSWSLRVWLHRDSAERLQINDFYLLQGAVCRLLGFAGHIVTWVRIHPSYFGRALSRIWLWMIGASSNRVVAVSEHVRVALPQKLGADVIYDHLPSPPHQPYSAETTKAPVTERRLVYIANYIEGKGQDDALEAFSAVAGEFPDLVLEFWGSDMGLEKNRRYLSRLQTRAAELNIAARVRFEGFVRHVNTVLRGAYAALNFSRAESFSMTVLEACGAGLPVVATRCGGPSEIVQDGVTGILVPVRNQWAMAAALRYVASNPGAVKAMGEAAAERVDQYFSARKFLPAIVAVLRLDRVS